MKTITFGFALMALAVAGATFEPAMKGEVSITGPATARVERHLRQHTPRGMRLFVEDLTGEAAGFRLPLASPVFRLAAAALEEMDPRGPVFQWDGASIPVVSTLRQCSGAAPLLVGWGQPQDRSHSPNESYGLEQFKISMTWAEKMLSAFMV